MHNPIGGIHHGGGSMRHGTAQPGNRFAAAPPAISYIPATPASGVDFISQVRSPLLPAEAFKWVVELTNSLGLTAAEMSSILAISTRSFAQRLHASLGAKMPDAADAGPSLTKAQSERLLLLKGVAEHGLAVFEDQDKFNRWLRRPLALLQNQSPLQFLDTVTGLRLVDQLLGRIEYGVYS